MTRGPGWSAEELRVVDRHVKALGLGRHVDALDAARACMAELELVWKARRPRVRRTLIGVRWKVWCRANEAGLCWSKHARTQVEIRLVEPYARAYMRGDYRSASDAAQACYAALPERVRAVRASCSICRLLLQLGGKRGKRGHRHFGRPFDARESRVIDRYVRAVYEGRYEHVRQAVPDCLAELERLRRGRPDAALVRPRTLRSVRSKLTKRSAALGLPRYHGSLTPKERELCERFARKVHRGELPDWLTAAKRCRAAIKRYYARRSRLPTGAPRRLTSRCLHTLHAEIRGLARRLNLRGPRCIGWSEPEMKLLESWLRWYARHRRTKTLHPWKQAVAGLQGDLKRLGSHRTTAACRGQLRKFFDLRRKSRGHGR